MIILAVVLLLVVVFFTSIINYLVDYQWFTELNFKEIFFKKLVTQVQFFVPAFLIILGLLFTYLKMINAHSEKKSGIGISAKARRTKNLLFAAISAAVAFVFSLVFVSEIWYNFLIYINKTPFNLTDPIFNKDISFYIFELPFLGNLYSFSLGLVFILFVINILYNSITFLAAEVPGHVNQDNITTMYKPENIYKNILSAASRQLTLLGGLFFLILAFGFYIRMFELLYSSKGIAYGASYTDINVTLPFYYAYIAISLLTAVLMLVSWGRKKLKLAAFGPILLIVAIVASGLVATGVQSVVVAPNELAKQEQYLQNNINYTNYAYGLDKVEVKPFAYKQNLTAQDIEENRVTVDNIPVNDYRLALDIYNQIQGLKNYYQFNDLDIDRYMINGVYRQVFIAPRELLTSNIPSQNQGSSWINKYLKFTHGYGIAMSPVNEVTPSGQPRLFIKDLPVVSDVDIKVERPEIYYGELTKDFVIVNTREKEFDYPASNTNVETSYEGTGGIKLNLLNRIMFAVREGKLNFLLSQDINANSKVLINREIKARVQKVAPFLIYDEDPYIVAADGKLYWIIDAYTVSSRYPYSEPVDERSNVNYIRNSVKVVIDAYNGTTTYYIADNTDPIIKTYANIFKTVFKPLDEMPESLRAHIRYPQTLFDIQSAIYRKYHIKEARELYNKSDIWDIATQIYNTEGNTNAESVESTYLIMRLPDSKMEEFLLMIPYTPQGKTNMIAWLAVKNDGEDYGKLVQYNFPSGQIVEGPMQVEGIVSQDTVIGPQLNLLATGGNSQVVRGNMLTIPIEESMLYVEPIYVRSINANALPEMKKVIVYYKNRVIMEDTLEQGLERIFDLSGNKPQLPGQPQQPQLPTGEQEDTAALITRANEAFRLSQEAMKSGNWTEYGTRLKELEEILNKLNVLTDQGNNQQAPVQQDTEIQSSETTPINQ
ncbi:MAG: hypothetical protein A2Y23_03105 [Clostridiales bacterium GWB2_37_7]|nr:MAG: hypothetical protein A2Y23_03105 [Clostridiales bacterium GWB2_37_7]